MGKFICLIITLSMLLSLICGCSYGDSALPSDTEKSTETEATKGESTKNPTARPTESETNAPPKESETSKPNDKVIVPGSVTDSSPPEEPINWATYTWVEVEQPEGEVFPEDIKIDENGKVLCKLGETIEINSLWVYQELLRRIDLPDNFVSAEQLVKLGEFRKATLWFGERDGEEIYKIIYSLEYNGTDLSVAVFSDEHSHPTVYNNTSFEAMTQPYIVYAVPEDIFFGLQSRKNAYYCPGGWCWLYNNNGLSYIGFRINGSSIFISPEGNWVKALNIGRNVEWLVDILEYPEYFVDIDGIVDEQWIPFENR